MTKFRESIPARTLIAFYATHCYILLLAASLLVPSKEVFASEPQEHKDQPALFVELQDYALLSNAAYRSRESVAQMATEMGNELTLYEHLSKLGVIYFLLTDSVNKTQWIAIRGTVNVENTLVNLDVQLIPNEDIGIQLHSGFAETAKEIFQNIKPKLKKEYAIKITGHSLGGAVATVLAMYLDTNNFPVTKVVTFGQPKVTNITGAQKFSHLDILRVVAAKDFIPLLPPVDLVDINNVGIYWPLGQEIILLDNNEYSITNGLNSMLRATKYLNKAPDMNNLKEHQIAYYTQAIKNRQQSAKWIPYKNDFSIFSIFGDKQ